MQSETYLKNFSPLYALIFLLITSCANAVNISVNPNVKYQTMTGWETNGWANQVSPEFDNFKAQLFDLIVNDAGFNRTRLEVRSGAENNKDYWTLYETGQITLQEWRSNRYATVNDNADPLVIDSAGFHFSEVDDFVDKVILPLKQLVEANNEKLYINLVYVAFTSQISGGSYNHDDPAEYAEFILATFLHLEQKYGWTPDAVELTLEPDNVAEWNGNLIGRALVEVAGRLKTAGFTPDFIAPSTTNMANASAYFDAMIAVPGAASLITELSYHRYSGVSDQALQDIVTRAANFNINTSMLEWWFGPGHTGYKVLHEDVKVGMNSAWEQGGMAGTFGSSPLITDAYLIDFSAPGSPVVTINDMTKFSRQYYKYIRAGAVRIDATSDGSNSDPLAFINTNGKYVVVIKTDAGQSLTIDGLPAGTYGIKYATSSQYDVDQPDQSLSNGASLVTNIPASGVITVYAKTIAGNTDTIPPSPPTSLTAK